MAKCWFQGRCKTRRRISRTDYFDAGGCIAWSRRTKHETIQHVCLSRNNTVMTTEGDNLVERVRMTTWLKGDFSCSTIKADSSIRESLHVRE